MKYNKIVYTLAIVLTISLVGAENVKAQNNSYQGSSSSSTAAVNQNGTQWTAELDMTGRNDQRTEEAIESVKVNENGKSTFKGIIEAPNPCHLLEQEVEKLGDGEFYMNIKTVEDESAGGVCTTQIAMIEYEANFQNDEGYTLDVRHNNETIDEIKFSPANDDYEPAPRKEGKSAFSSVLDWLRGIF